jgi:uncharacterized protein YmfQ (DUF2313 family)
MTASFSAHDYLGAMQALMPRGRVWPRDIDAKQTQLLLALAQVYERSDGRSRQLLVDGFPQSSVELLPEWEATLGLPDSCGGTPDSIAERQARLVVKLQEPGGMSKGYFLNLATVLGYADVTITEFGPTNCGMTCEIAVMDEQFRFLWKVNLPHQVNNREAFRVGSRCDERIDRYTFGALECQLMRLKPAHTQVIFTYKEIADEAY